MWIFRRIGAMADGIRWKKAEGVYGKSFDQDFMIIWLTSATMRRGGPTGWKERGRQIGGRRKVGENDGLLSWLLLLCARVEGSRASFGNFRFSRAPYAYVIGFPQIRPELGHLSSNSYLFASCVAPTL